jgi:hypothetical protein
MSVLRCAPVVAVLLSTLLFSPNQRALAGEELASVKGNVSLDGRPLAFGKVIFHLADGQFVGSKIKEDGSFKVDRVPLGTHTITVEAMKTEKGRKLNVIPERYASEEKSQLRVEVRKGKNQFDLHLNSR